MFREIAVFLDNEGFSGALSEPGQVIVYRRFQGTWQVERSRDFAPDTCQGMKELRQMMSTILDFLDGCRICVAKAVSGVPFFELEKAGCNIYEMSGKPETFLDTVLSSEEHEEIRRNVSTLEAIPGPYEISPGSFFISIKEIQGKNPALTSKQVLQAFVQAGTFNSLEIICDHIPPWIEMESERHGYRMQVEKKEMNELRITISKSG